MLTALTLVAASLLGGAVGALIVYRVYAPKMEGRLKQSVLMSTDRWMKDGFAGYRQDAKALRKHDNLETLKLLSEAVKNHTEQRAAETYTTLTSDFAKLAQTLQEQVDALTQDAADAIDGGLDNRITNIVMAVLAAKPVEGKMDGVSTDKPDEEDDADKRQATGGKFHM